jgi:hypothetical protein
MWGIEIESISEDCEDRREHVAGAAPGCPFISNGFIYFIAMTKKE